MSIFDFFGKKKEEPSVEKLQTDKKVIDTHEIRAESYKANNRLFSGYRFLATLDTRTCLVCGSLDGEIFDSPEMPHICLKENCRCLILPIVKGMEEPFDDDERASMDGPVSAKLTYAEWLKKQPVKRKREILGEYYDRYKAGESLQEIVSSLGK